MKKEMSVKTRRILFLIAGLIWTASAAVNIWSLIVRWQSVDDGQLVMRGLTILLALVCAVLNFVNWHRWKKVQ